MLRCVNEIELTKEMANQDTHTVGAKEEVPAAAVCEAIYSSRQQRLPVVMPSARLIYLQVYIPKRERSTSS